jgi:integrase
MSKGNILVLTKNKFLTDQELKYLLRLCNKYPGRDSLLIRLILFTGCRGCEALNVRKKDISEGCVTIYAAKGSNDRTLPLPPDYLQELTEYINPMKDSDRLFPISVRMLRWIWSKWRINPNKGIHSLRHTFGIKVYTKSKDIRILQFMLGHKNGANTMKYLQYVECQDEMRGVLNEMYDV